MYRKRFLVPTFLLFASLCLCTGCGSLVRGATAPLMDNLSTSVMKQQDTELVRLGAPAYLILMDGLLEGSPDDPAMLLAAAKLYTAYGMAFAQADSEQSRLMSAKAKEYAVRAMALRNDTFASLYDRPAEEFGPVAESLEPGDEPYILALVSAWAAYITARPGSWDDFADIPKIEALAVRLLALDETYSLGTPHMILGILKTLLPADLGGKPDEAREHFERALTISKGEYLPVYVAYAVRYARTVYDRELHDTLLQHVLDAPADILPGQALANALAKRDAERLLAEADEYF